MKNVYVLMLDDAGTMSSRPMPIGNTVNTEEEAKKWVEEGSSLWRRTYWKVHVDDLDELTHTLDYIETLLYRLGLHHKILNRTLQPDCLQVTEERLRNTFEAIVGQRHFA